MSDVYEAKRKYCEIKLLDGKTIEVARPTISEYKQVTQKIKDAEVGDVYIVVEEFLAEKGLTKEILENNFSVSEYMDLFHFINGLKKN